MLKNRYIVENLWGEVVTQPSGLFFSFEELIWRWERRTILLFVWHINFHPLRIILKFYEKYGNGLIWCLFFFFFMLLLFRAGTWDWKNTCLIHETALLSILVLFGSEALEYYLSRQRRDETKNMKLWWKVGNRGNCISVGCRWSELRSKMSVVSGVISRQVLPACGNLCFLCPSLRTRSRQPVKRYKKLIADIFPRSQVSFLNFIYICLYACIFWSYPFYNVYFKVVSQPDDGLF